MCSFDSNDCVMLFSENKYDDDDDIIAYSDAAKNNEVRCKGVADNTDATSEVREKCSSHTVLTHSRP